MRILLISESLENNFLFLWKEKIEKLGHSVCLFNQIKSEPEKGIFSYFSLKVPFLKRDIFISFPILSFKLLKKIFREKWDIIYVYNPFWFRNIIVFISRLRKIPLVFIFDSPFLRTKICPTNSRADLFIVHSPEDKKLLRQRNRRGTSIIILPPSVSAKDLERTTEKIVNIYRLNLTGWQSWTIKTDYFWRLITNRTNPLGAINYEKIELPLNQRNRKKSPILGWNSWNAFGKDISGEKILSQLKIILQWQKSLPLEYLVIDDGWTKWGDWKNFDAKKFPSGIETIVKQIKDAGLKPGIWLAPFLVEKKSNFFKNNRQLFIFKKNTFITDHQRVPIIEVLNWKLNAFLADFKNPRFWDYLFEGIDYLLGNIGFKLIKLDFLFSAYFYPDISPQDASQAIRRVLRYIKSKYSDVFIICCGCPLSDALTLTDAMRIGPDSPGLFWGRYLPLINRIRVKQIYNNVIKRSWTSKFWILDPDTFVCGRKYGLKEVDILLLSKAIRTANGVIFLGDDLSSLTKEQIEKYLFALLK